MLKHCWNPHRRKLPLPIGPDPAPLPVPSSVTSPNPARRGKRAQCCHRLSQLRFLHTRGFARMMAERKRKFFNCKSMFLNPFSRTQVSLPLPHTSL